MILIMLYRFNRYRDINRMYDFYEVYIILYKVNIIKESYELFEEIIVFFKVFIKKGRSLFFKALEKFVEFSVVKVVIYICGIYIYL